jgi:hypothetical protein
MDIKIAQQVTITELVLENQKLKQECDIAEDERDKAKTELEMWRDGNILNEVHRNELEKTERERDEALGELSLKQQTLTIAEGTLSDLRKQRDEWSAMCGRYKQERDELLKKTK